MKKCLSILFACCAIAGETSAMEGRLSERITLKTPGNPAATYDLRESATEGGGILEADQQLPLTIRRQKTETENEIRIVLTLTATDLLYYNVEALFTTGLTHENCLFYMPGFWYHKNLRSPKSAPSFHTSDSWQVREDRLSTPLTGIYDEKSGTYYTVLRTDTPDCEALACHNYGDVILSGKTSLGFTGFRNADAHAALVFGFPYCEAPKSYVRKLTLAPAVRAFEKLEKGETRRLTWTLRKGVSPSYSSFVADVWNYSFDALDPQPVKPRYTPAEAKAILAEYFAQSYVGDYPLKYTSGVELRTADCESTGIAEIGFVGRVLLNAYNALEYGEANGREDLAANARSIFDSYLRYGFTPGGLLREVVDFKRERETDVYSIRRQSEGVYALLNYLAYEKQQGRSHPEWEARIRTLLEKFLSLQNPDGSFPRKFRDNLTVVDASGGSTPSATLPLTMAYTYFKNEAYRRSARRTADYLEKNLISKADYFSSTLDANCEDKEASLYAATAMYYMTFVSEGTERQRYIDLCREAAYFALSWYYLWDVPFAQGQMLGDAGFRSRGWGNVSVENNHVDVFIFEFATVLDFLAETCNEPRFSRTSAVIKSSMLQLMPVEGSMFEIGRTGYYPEVVQHTAWDYGKNGKGFYNDIFAPGWTVASLWQMLSPDRVTTFFAN
ncbi:MAG: hypothetical protein EGP78_02700 [Alistipes shahii]|jgi:hypothetical protein|nr:hypothetical protein [Alistipes shahii]